MKFYHRAHPEATTKRWRPGDPIPPAGSGIEPDPHAALARHVEAAEREQQRHRFTKRRTYRGGRKEAA
jgi:hypothetical protein